MGKNDEAAEVYVKAAPLAQAIEEPFLEMEAWRMAAYCYEKEKTYQAAVQYGEFALIAGEKMPEEEREPSTLVYVGDAFIRVIKCAKKQMRLFTITAAVPEEDAINDRMVALMGEDWQASVINNAEGVLPS